MLTNEGAEVWFLHKMWLRTALCLARAFSLSIQAAAMTCAARKKKILPLLVLVYTGRNKRPQVNPAIARSHHFKQQKKTENQKENKQKPH